METIKQDVTNLISISEYARKKSVSRQTIYNWAADKEKDIEIIKIGGRPFVKPKN